MGVRSSCDCLCGYPNELSKQGTFSWLFFLGKKYLNYGIIFYITDLIFESPSFFLSRMIKNDVAHYFFVLLRMLNINSYVFIL